MARSNTPKLTKALIEEADWFVHHGYGSMYYELHVAGWLESDDTLTALDMLKHDILSKEWTDVRFMLACFVLLMAGEEF